MRSQLVAAERAGARQREKILDGAPLAQIVQGLQQIEAVVAADKARIAYIKAHPGVLPAEVGRAGRTSCLSTATFIPGAG